MEIRNLSPTAIPPLRGRHEDFSHCWSCQNPKDVEAHASRSERLRASRGSCDLKSGLVREERTPVQRLQLF